MKGINTTGRLLVFVMDSDDNNNKKTLLNKQSLPPSTPHTPASQSHPPPTPHIPASQSRPPPTPHTPASQSRPPPTPHTSTPIKQSRTYEDYSSDEQRSSNLRNIQRRFEMSQKNKGIKILYYIKIFCIITYLLNN